MSAVKYRDGSDTRLGHRVIYNNQVGTVVVAIDDEEGSPGFPIENYQSYGGGILIRFDNGALLQLAESDKLLVRDKNDTAGTGNIVFPEAAVPSRPQWVDTRPTGIHRWCALGVGSPN